MGIYLSVGNYKILLFPHPCIKYSVCVLIGACVLIRFFLVCLPTIPFLKSLHAGLFFFHSFVVV